MARTVLILVALSAAGAGTSACTSSSGGEGSSDASFVMDVTFGGDAPNDTSPDGGSPADGSAPLDATGSDASATDASALSVIGTIALPAPPNSFAYDPATKTIWITSQGPNDAGVSTSALTVVDRTTLNVTQTLLLGSGAQLGAIAVAPDLHKTYVANAAGLDGGFASTGEIDEIDGVSFAVKTVATFQGAFQLGSGLAYDPGAHRVYAAVSGAYAYVIDAQSDTVVATLPQSAVSAAGLSGYGQLVASPTGGELFMSTGDVNFYPMLAAFQLDAGVVTTAFGGQDAGWSTATGPVLVEAGAAAIITPSSGTPFIQIFDGVGPVITLHPGDTYGAVAVIPPSALLGGALLVSVRDACMKYRFRAYDPNTGVELGDWDLAPLGILALSSNIRQMVTLDSTTNEVYLLIDVQPDDTSSQKPNDEVLVVRLQTSGGKAPPCP